jgi:hypothetical protein
MLTQAGEVGDVLLLSDHLGQLLRKGFALLGIGVNDVLDLVTR